MNEFKDIDCAAFVPVYAIGALKMAESDDGLKHVLHFRGGDGTAYEGPSPFMIQRNVIGFLQRENGIAQARKRGYRVPR